MARVMVYHPTTNEISVDVWGSYANYQCTRDCGSINQFTWLSICRVFRAYHCNPFDGLWLYQLYAFRDGVCIGNCHCIILYHAWFQLDCTKNYKKGGDLKTLWLKKIKHKMLY